MTDKQIDINNQVEVGLNIAKELLELHKMFEDEVEKSPYFIQTNFIKNKLFYFYQRADWLNVCFNLLDKQLQAKEQECEELKYKIFRYEELLKHSAMAQNTYTAEEVNTIASGIKFVGNSLIAEENNKLHKTLIEIKEIARVNSINTCWTAINLCADCDEAEECGLQSPFEKLKAIIQIISECEGNND